LEISEILHCFQKLIFESVTMWKHVKIYLSSVRSSGIVIPGPTRACAIPSPISFKSRDSTMDQTELIAVMFILICDKHECNSNETLYFTKVRMRRHLECALIRITVPHKITHFKF